MKRCNYSILSAFGLIMVGGVAEAGNVKPHQCAKLDDEIVIGFDDNEEGNLKISAPKKLSLEPHIYFKLSNLNKGVDNVFHIRFATKFLEKKLVAKKTRLFRNKPKTVCHTKTDDEEKSEFETTKKRFFSFFGETVRADVDRDVYAKFLAGEISADNALNLSTTLKRGWNFKYNPKDRINDHCVETRKTVERGGQEPIVDKEKRIFVPKHGPVRSPNDAIASEDKFVWIARKDNYYSSILIDAEPEKDSTQACYKVSLKRLLGRVIYTADLTPISTNFQIKRLPGHEEPSHKVKYNSVKLDWK